MHRRARTAFSWSEFLLVVLGAFGPFIASSLYLAVNPTDGPAYTNTGLIYLVAYEIVILTLLGFFLHHRGWTVVRLGFFSKWLDPFIGIGLAAASYVLFLAACVGYQTAVSSLEHALTALHWEPSGLSIVAVIAATAINPIFEEVFVAGYVITVLKKERGTTLAVNVSTALRLLYHLYQGPSGVMLAVPVGLLFGYWYAWRGRLWPLILAHALLDFFPLLYVLKF